MSTRSSEHVERILFKALEIQRVVFQVAVERSACNLGLCNVQGRRKRRRERERGIESSDKQARKADLPARYDLSVID